MRRLAVVLRLAVLAVGLRRQRRRSARAAAPAAEGGPTVAMMPKNKGNPYFVSCRKGAEEAAEELGRQAALGRAHRDRSRPSRTRSSRPGSRAASTSSR